ncbi:UNVERIFIED_CONTAM: hypothetical protein FKN15_044431 [Acipenser sinensis]
MDDVTTMTTTVACTNWLLGKLTNNIEWAQMQFKPTKSRSISIIKGKVVDKMFYINGEAIPTVSVKSLGRWYDGDLKDTVRVGEVRQQAVEGLKSIDSSALPGKLKLWCFQFGLVPRLLWPLTMYEVSLTTLEKLEALISSYIRKWLGVPRCLSRVGLYGKGILQLPVSALTEEFKCAKVQLEKCISRVSQQMRKGGSTCVENWKKVGRQRKLWKMQRLPFELVISWGKFSMEEGVLISVQLLLHGTRQPQINGGSW